MHSIATIAATAPAAIGNLGGQLPWGWFTAMALADLCLVMVALSRRRAAREHRGPDARSPRPEGLVLRSGWRVPRSRAITMRPEPGVYAWPLHTEYMVSRLG